MTYTLLDVSRLCMRARNAAPSGIDRVEYAYAVWLLEQDPAKTGFVVTLPGGAWFQLPRPLAEKLVRALAQRWRQGSSDVSIPKLYGLLGRAALADSLRRSLRLARPPAGPVVYVNVSHHLLHRPAALRPLRRFFKARFVVLMHDLNPITHPEYFRPGHAEQHRRRLAVATELADGIIANSEATVREIVRRRPKAALIRAAALGVDTGKLSDAPSGKGDYFLCVGTIEPRKNQLLLLHLWRAMAETRAANAIPKLLIVGRRGWENEMILDMLERCEAIRPFVEERNAVADDELTGLIRGALAVLMPSFAEGFGLPVGEALALGAPVICSDLPAHRELGGDAPEYLDPLDGAAWRATIEGYAASDSPARAAQLERIRRWRAPRWTDHFAVASDLIEEVAQGPRPAGTVAFPMNGERADSAFESDGAIVRVHPGGNETPARKTQSDFGRQSERKKISSSAK